MSNPVDISRNYVETIHELSLSLGYVCVIIHFPRCLVRRYTTSLSRLIIGVYLYIIFFDADLLNTSDRYQRKRDIY
ncbi:MAG: hypothetical protein KME31_00330 [Tolypothrix carrinoi HA7290-LM1]|jgi:hypothetical protein|nr:hypothetical protein [Tolypothrix carrinoi HA7290-LM1]